MASRRKVPKTNRPSTSVSVENEVPCMTTRAGTRSKRGTTPFEFAHAIRHPCVSRSSSIDPGYAGDRPPRGLSPKHIRGRLAQRPSGCRSAPVSSTVDRAAWNTRSAPSSFVRNLPGPRHHLLPSFAAHSLQGGSSMRRPNSPSSNVSAANFGLRGGDPESSVKCRRSQSSVPRWPAIPCAMPAMPA